MGFPVHPRVCGERLRCPATHRISCPVHPRVCGERRFLPVRGSTISGSSPRVRGTRLHAHPVRGQRRFIPACAGNAWSPPTAAVSRSVHPRVCGERHFVVAPCQAGSGSSPRVRGTRELQSHYPRYERFIPACAGNAPRFRRFRERQSVHPRVCGERIVRAQIEGYRAGSSPRVRGTLRSRQRQDEHEQVHPRVCGERTKRIVQEIAGNGSSPRVRGTRNKIAEHVAGRRFIPACAGNASDILPFMPASPVHPRVCGERQELAAMNTNSTGSSPRVRGTHGSSTVSPSCDRFIPACAGNAHWR